MQDPFADAADEPTFQSMSGMSAHDDQFAFELFGRLNNLVSGLTAGDMISDTIRGQIDWQGGKVLLDPIIGNLIRERDWRPFFGIFTPGLPNMQQVEKGISRLSLLDGQR
jgi:hypothetical protein